MAMVVKNNMTALNTLNTLNKNSSALAKSLQKVSSGMKINSAADDASGYAISERMRVQIRSLDQANQNTQNGSSMMKVAEGAVSSTVEILKTLKEKAVNAANDSNTDADRQTIQKELDQSIDQINDNANVTFNGKYLVDGSKNTIGNATYTALSNQSLAEDTKADTKLVDLAARSGDSLQIHENDKVTVSYVQGGKTHTATFQVTKDSTLQDIFNAAENADASSKIFASSDNASVQKAGGAEGVSGVSAEEKAIDYLKSQLANGTSNATAGTIDANSAYAATNANTGGKISTAAAAAGGTAADLNGAGYKDTNGDFYAAGSLYTALTDADKAVKKAEDAQGTFNATGTGTGSINTLQKDLLKAGITDWDGNIASLETSSMKARLDTALADQTNDTLAASLAAYKEDVADYDKAVSAFDGARKDYETAQGQLKALEAAKKVSDAEGVAKGLADALITVYNAKIDAMASTDKLTAHIIAAKKDGTEASDKEAFTDATLASDDIKAKAKEAFATSVNNILNFAKGLENGKGADAAKLLSADANFGNGNAGNTAVFAETDVAEFGNALEAIRDNYAAITSMDDLKSAQENVVSKFTGPAILTGSTVGVNAAGNTVSTASGGNAITITAANAGIGGQISGFNISVSDSEGNVKKSANAALDAFEETVRAQNKSDDNAINLQVGAKANQSIKIGLTDMRAEALGLQGADGTKLNISTQNKANAAINVLDNAIAKALDQQTTIGSVESRLEYTSSNLTTASENVQASESTIRDADMAKEMMQYTKNNVLLQAAQSMLAQANQSSSNVLSLLQ